jgi:hypothetical protein
MPLNYKFSNKTVKLPKHDSDLRVKLPNGLELLIQYRNENDTTDICLTKDGMDQKCVVQAFNGDLTEAKKLPGKNCCLAEQVLITLPK